MLIKREHKNIPLDELESMADYQRPLNYDFIEENDLSFERKLSGIFEWKYNGKIYQIDGTKDCIYEFINMI